MSARHIGVHFLRTESGNSARWRLAGACILRGLASARRGRSVWRSSGSAGPPGDSPRTPWPGRLSGGVLPRPFVLISGPKRDVIQHTGTCPCGPQCAYRRSGLPPFPLRMENSAPREPPALRGPPVFRLRPAGCKREKIARHVSLSSGQLLFHDMTCIPILRTIQVIDIAIDIGIAITT